MDVHSLGAHEFPESKTVQPHEVDWEMYSLWLSFNYYLGIQCDGSLEPSQGYKFETNPTQRDRYIGLAIRMRNKYAALTMRFGKGGQILEQMTDILTKIDKKVLE